MPAKENGHLTPNATLLGFLHVFQNLSQERSNFCSHSKKPDSWEAAQQHCANMSAERLKSLKGDRQSAWTVLFKMEKKLSDASVCQK